MSKIFYVWISDIGLKSGHFKTEFFRVSEIWTSPVFRHLRMYCTPKPHINLYVPAKNHLKSKRTKKFVCVTTYFDLNCANIHTYNLFGPFHTTPHFWVIAFSLLTLPEKLEKTKKIHSQGKKYYKRMQKSEK